MLSRQRWRGYGAAGFPACRISLLYRQRLRLNKPYQPRRGFPLMVNPRLQPGGLKTLNTSTSLNIKGRRPRLSPRDPRPFFSSLFPYSLLYTPYSHQRCVPASPRPTIELPSTRWYTISATAGRHPYRVCPIPAMRSAASEPQRTLLPSASSED